jgi:hypothetical protein
MRPITKNTSAMWSIVLPSGRVVCESRAVDWNG